MPIARPLLALVLACLPCAAGATLLYKSIAPDGSVMFSDVPPQGDARIVEQRVVGTPSGSRSDSPRPAGGAEQLLNYDEAVARANERFDMAEHALATARRGVWSAVEFLHHERPRANAGESLRVELYKRDVLLARQALMELLRERRMALLAP